MSSRGKKTSKSKFCKVCRGHKCLQTFVLKRKFMKFTGAWKVKIQDGFGKKMHNRKKFFLILMESLISMWGNIWDMTFTWFVDSSKIKGHLL